jgi:hypothetical protein
MNDAIRDKMCEDYLFNTRGNKVLANNMLLELFSKRFRQENKENSQYIWITRTR